MVSINNTYIGSPDDPRTPAWLCYVTLIGWIVAYLAFYRHKPTELARFHLRQALLLHILSFVLNVALSAILLSVWYVFYALILLYVCVVILWFIGLLDAVSSRMRPIPFIGRWAQSMFQGIG